MVETDYPLARYRGLKTDPTTAEVQLTFATIEDNTVRITMRAADFRRLRKDVDDVPEPDLKAKGSRSPP